MAEESANHLPFWHKNAIGTTFDRIGSVFAKKKRIQNKGKQQLNK